MKSIWIYKCISFLCSCFSLSHRRWCINTQLFWYANVLFKRVPFKLEKRSYAHVDILRCFHSHNVRIFSSRCFRIIFSCVIVYMGHIEKVILPGHFVPSLPSYPFSWLRQDKIIKGSDILSHDQLKTSNLSTTCI